jgi:hypothetical protein
MYCRSQWEAITCSWAKAGGRAAHGHVPVKLDPVDMAGDIGEQAEDGLSRHCQELPGVGPFSKQKLNKIRGSIENVMAY